MEEDRVDILESDLTYAQSICAHIVGAEKHAQAMASLVGAKIAGRYFEEKDDYTVDTASGLHNLGSMLQFLDISDIYVNNAYVGVRVYFSDDEINVPEVHYKAGILPAVYMFIKLEEDLSYGTVTGFVFPNRIDVSRKFNGMIRVPKESFCSFEQIKNVLDEVEESTDNYSEQIYEFVEQTLEPAEIANLFKHLIHSKVDRQKLLKVLKAQSTLYSLNNLKQEQISSEIQEESAEEDLDELFDAIDMSSDNSDENSFEYTTEVTPSGSEIIESMNLESEQNDSDEENMLESANEDENDENTYDVETLEDSENSEDIEALFDGEPKSVPINKKGNFTIIICIMLVLILVCGLTYFIYSNWNQVTDYFNNLKGNNVIEENVGNINSDDEKESKISNEVVMPVETVEPVKTSVSKEEGNAVTIPAIERNLDSSVLISNLKVDWEVPSGYVSNTATKKYFIKLGKIIQFNLKTELLLLNKPPLSNKISVELRYNSNAEKFEVVGIKDSSGEETVDEAILKVVKNSLNNSASGISTFGKVQGNPLIIIRL